MFDSVVQGLCSECSSRCSLVSSAFRLRTLVKNIYQY